MKTLEELKTAINEQINREAKVLLNQIKDGHFSVNSDRYGAEISVLQSVEQSVFEDNDLVEQFHSENSEYGLEDLRDIQHQAINSISDVIEANEVARSDAGMDKSKKWAVAWTPSKNDNNIKYQVEKRGGRYVLKLLSRADAIRIARDLNYETSDSMGYYSPVKL